MVTERCKVLVKKELKKMNLAHFTIELGVIELLEEISRNKKIQLKKKLLKHGLEILDDKKSILIEKIKIVIIDMIHYSEEIPKINYSGYLSQELGYDYNYLANIFTEVKGITIQQYIISHKIEKVKELLLYNELQIKEIANKLHYSSAAHLSYQFKKVTGVSPSFYKKMQLQRRKNLENL